MKNTNLSFFVNIKVVKKDLCRKHPVSTISKGCLFIIQSAKPNFVTVKSAAAAAVADEQAKCDLAKGSRAKSKTQDLSIS